MSNYEIIEFLAKTVNIGMYFYSLVPGNLKQLAEERLASK